MRLSNQNNRGGFTLIELLVVIAIIGILAGMVLVSFGNVRAKSRAVQRAAILRDLSIALEIEYAISQHYPNTCGINPEAPPSSCGPGNFIRVRHSCNFPDEYIPLLVAHDIMSELPHDPQEYCGGMVISSIITYASNGADYKIIIRNPEGCEQGQGKGTFGYLCGGTPPWPTYWVIQTPGAVDWPVCLSQFPNQPPYPCI